MVDPQLQSIDERISNLELLVKTNREVVRIVVEEVNIRITMLELRVKKLMQNSHRHSQERAGKRSTR